MDHILETERLTLRRFTTDDVDLLHELDNSPGVMRFIDNGKPPSRTEVAERILPSIIDDYVRFDGLGRWAAFERSAGSFVGWFALRPTSPDALDDVELGYRLLPKFWGVGLATEGARELVRQAFTELGIRRVWSTTMTVNTGSRRVMEKAGLKYVRTFFEQWPQYLDGAERGDVEYVVTCEDWQSATPD